MVDQSNTKAYAADVGGTLRDAQNVVCYVALLAKELTWADYTPMLLQEGFSHCSHDGLDGRQGLQWLKPS